MKYCFSLCMLMLIFSGCQTLQPGNSTTSQVAPNPTTEVSGRYLIGFEGGSVQNKSVGPNGIALRTAVSDFKLLNGIETFEIVLIRRAGSELDIAVAAEMLRGPGGAIPVMPNDAVLLANSADHFPKTVSPTQGVFTVTGAVQNGGPRSFKVAQLWVLNFPSKVRNKFEDVKLNAKTPEYLSVIRKSTNTGKPTIYYFPVLLALNKANGTGSKPPKFGKLLLRNGDIVHFSSGDDDPLLRGAMQTDQLRSKAAYDEQARTQAIPAGTNVAAAAANGKPKGILAGSRKSARPTSLLPTWNQPNINLPKLGGGLPNLGF